MTTHAHGPASASDWLGRPPKDSPERPKFAAAFNELLRAKKFTHIDFAVEYFGRHPKTKKPRNVQMVRDWCTGDKFPNPTNAAKIAKLFGVPLARLLSPKGPLITDVKTRAAPHKKTPAHESPPPPRELPKGAPPLEYTLKNYKNEPHFARIAISGVCEVKIARTIFALLDRNG